jgi:acyl-CoA thioesterase-1
VKGVHFIAMADLVPHGDGSFHGLDMIHPSIKGSNAIGTRIATYIRKQSK